MSDLKLPAILCLTCLWVLTIEARTANTKDVLGGFTLESDVKFDATLIDKVAEMLSARLKCNPNCYKCLDSAQLDSIIKDRSAGPLSVILLNRIAYFGTVCNDISNDASNCSDYELCNLQLFGEIKFADSIKTAPTSGTTQTGPTAVTSTTSPVDLKQLYDDNMAIIKGRVQDVLRRVNVVYSPNKTEPCFGPDILEDLNSHDFPLTKQLQITYNEKLSILIMNKLLTGSCINVPNASEEYLDILFGRFTTDNNTVDAASLAKLFKTLKIQNKDHNHDHDHDENAHHDHNHDHEHSPVHNHSHSGHDEDDHEHGPGDGHEDHDHGHDGHDHSDHSHDHEVDEVLKSHIEASKNLSQRHLEYMPVEEWEVSVDSITNPTVPLNSGQYMPRIKRSLPEHAQSLNGPKDKCLGVNDMLEKFSLTQRGLVNRNEFLDMCPALLQLSVSGSCNIAPEKKKSQPPSNLELYGYSSLAVFIISLTSCVVVVILPLMGKTIYQYLLMCLIGLAFGTMCGDALLHLIPQALGLHTHGGEEEDHGSEGHDHNAPVTLDTIPQYFWRQLGIMAAIYAIFLFESFVEMFGKKTESHNHGHSHVPDQLPPQLQKKTPKAESVMELTSYKSSSQSLENGQLDHRPPEDSEVLFNSPIVCCGLRSLALMITIGDTIHNIGDGLAIGASYSTSLQDGLATSIAVFCHELPHEFGDFVVLLSTGLSFKKALFINFISALSCFIGLYIGIFLGSDAQSGQWVLTITAGIFLYIALAEMLPELKQTKAGVNQFAMFIVKNVGVLVGIGLMIVIALYEDKIGR